MHYLYQTYYIDGLVQDWSNSIANALEFLFEGHECQNWSWWIRWGGNVLENISSSVAPGDLSHWGRVTHTCVSNLAIIASDNGLSPGRRQTIIWINAGIVLIEPLGSNFHEILIGIHTFSFNKMHFKMSSAKQGPFCLGINVLTPRGHNNMPAIF